MLVNWALLALAVHTTSPLSPALSGSKPRFAGAHQEGRAFTLSVWRLLPESPSSRGKGVAGRSTNRRWSPRRSTAATCAWWTPPRPSCSRASAACRSRVGPVTEIRRCTRRPSATATTERPIYRKTFLPFQHLFLGQLTTT